MKKVFVAGHNGMVGRAICKKLKDDPTVETITVSRGELDLCDQKAVQMFFRAEKPDEVILPSLNFIGAAQAVIMLGAKTSTNCEIFCQ